MKEHSTQVKRFRYGGQAVYEGVLIRGEKSLATAVRTQTGDIAVDSKPLPDFYNGRIRRIPLVRGIVILLETLVLGTQALMNSANMAVGDEEEISSGLMWGTVVLGLVLGIALFFLAPLLLAKYLIFPYTTPLLGNFLEGLIRIGMFMVYLRLTRMMPDVRRIYAYHGAEHKVINAYEHGVKLEPAEVRAFSTAHTRCGTSFLLIVLVISILVYSIVGRPALWVTMLSRVVLLPVIVVIGYELVRAAADHSESRIVRILLTPGLALQSMTTAEPDEGQIEVALMSLKTALATDEGIPAPVPNPALALPSPS